MLQFTDIPGIQNPTKEDAQKVKDVIHMVLDFGYKAGRDGVLALEEHLDDIGGGLPPSEPNTAQAMRDLVRQTIDSETERDMEAQAFYTVQNADVDDVDRLCLMIAAQGMTLIRQQAGSRALEDTMLSMVPQKLKQAGDFTPTYDLDEPLAFFDEQQREPVADRAQQIQRQLHDAAQSLGNLRAQFEQYAGMLQNVDALCRMDCITPFDTTERAAQKTQQRKERARDDAAYLLASQCARTIADSRAAILNAARDMTAKDVHARLEQAFGAQNEEELKKAFMAGLAQFTAEFTRRHCLTKDMQDALTGRAPRIDVRQLAQKACADGQLPLGVSDALDGLANFDRLVLNASGLSLQRMLRETDQQELAVALSTSGQDVRQRIFSCMSKRAAAMLKEDIAYSGPVPLAKSQAAQARIAQDLLAFLPQEGQS